jgi:hypothetical protein
VALAMKSLVVVVSSVVCGALALWQEPARPVDLPRAFVDGSGPGWRALSLADFVNVNGDADTWTERDGVIVCTGKPNGGRG